MWNVPRLINKLFTCLDTDDDELGTRWQQEHVVYEFNYSRPITDRPTAMIIQEATAQGVAMNSAFSGDADGLLNGRRELGWVIKMGITIIIIIRIIIFTVNFNG